MQIRAVAALLLAVACASPSGPTARIGTPRGAVDVALEVANTPETRQRGLMYRTALADGHGMLFVFDADENHSFWMKNTFIPLDMIFIAADGRVVGVHANAKPYSLASVSVGAPSRYVLEVPGGWAEAHGVAAGAHVDLRGVPPPAG